MRMLKEIYNGAMPCDDCIHKKVCNAKKCFEETRFETTHPFVDIQVGCTEYIHRGCSLKRSQYDE